MGDDENVVDGIQGSLVRRGLRRSHFILYTHEPEEEKINGCDLWGNQTGSESR